MISEFKSSFRRFLLECDGDDCSTTPVSIPSLAGEPTQREVSALGWVTRGDRHFCAACARGYPVEPDEEQKAEPESAQVTHSVTVPLPEGSQGDRARYLRVWVEDVESPDHGDAGVEDDEPEAGPASGDLAYRLADLFGCKSTAEDILRVAQLLQAKIIGRGHDPDSWPAALSRRLADLLDCGPTTDEIVSAVELLQSLVRIRALRIGQLESELRQRLDEFREQAKLVRELNHDLVECRRRQAEKPHLANLAHLSTQLTAAENALSRLGRLVGCPWSATFVEMGRAAEAMIRRLTAELEGCQSAIKDKLEGEAP